MLHVDSGHSRSVQPRMYTYSVSSNTKEMFQLTGPGENAGSKNSHGLTVGSLLYVMCVSNSGPERRHFFHFRFAFGRQL